MMNAWFQNPDFSSEDWTIEDPQQAIDAFRSIEWEQYYSHLFEMRDKRKDCCPPNLGIKYEDAEFLQIIK